MLAIRLTEKLAKNPGYARAIGVEISNKKDCRKNTDKPFSEQSVTDSNIMYQGVFF